jgi:hypothetical protein
MKPLEWHNTKIKVKSQKPEPKPQKMMRAPTHFKYLISKTLKNESEFAAD